jgi:hypothetical protein
MTTLIGYEAINYAEANGLTLNKYNDPIEDAREGLSVDEARKVAAEDPALIYIPLAAEVSRLIALLGGRALVIDPVTDADETAEEIELRSLNTSDVRTITVSSPRIIRALYEHPSAESYGDGSYTVEEIRLTR